jgi:CHRD domain
MQTNRRGRRDGDNYTWPDPEFVRLGPRLDPADDEWLLALVPTVGGTNMTSLQNKKRIAIAAIFGGMLALVAGGCAVTEPASTNSRPISVPTIQTSPLALSGDQEVPAVITTALGTGTFEIPPDRSITGSVATTGINATAAHIHDGAVGKNGPVIVPLTKSGDNTWSVAPNTKLTDEQYASYLAGNLYVNVHSLSNPGGEIRAQLKPK